MFERNTKLVNGALAKNPDLGLILFPQTGPEDLEKAIQGHLLFLCFSATHDKEN